MNLDDIALSDERTDTGLGPINNSFVRHGITTFHEAASYIGGLPYGRTSDRANYRHVLSESTGVERSRFDQIALKETLSLLGDDL